MWRESRYDSPMTARPGAGKRRARGNIETLASGALRARVYAGIDPVTKKRHYLTEVIEPGPKAQRAAEDQGPGVVDFRGCDLGFSSD
jgi:hypothetical protein